MPSTRSLSPKEFKAAKLYAQANPSDPYAYTRIRTQLLNGVERADEVIEEAERQLKVRH